MSHFGSHKISKKADIQNLVQEFVACTLGYISTNLWANWTIFQEQVQFSVEIFFSNFCPVSEKKNVFFGQKSENFGAKFFKISEINSNHLNTLYSQILGHLKHFWRKNSNFYPFLGHFYPIYL